MTNLDELLKQEQQKMSSFENEETDYPAKHLKHDALYLNKDNPVATVRVLPPTSDDANIAEGYREIWVEGVNGSGKDVRTKLTLGATPDPDSHFDQQVNTWVQSGNIPNKYGSKPSKRFVLNVVRVGKDENGNFVHEVDEQGNIVVRIAQVPQTLYQGILEKIGNDNFEPEGVTDGLRVISEQNAYPFELKRTGTGIDTRYTVNVYERNLGALPNNWRDQAEDLAYQASKTPEDQNYANYVIAVANGKEAEFQQQQNGESGGQVQQQNDPFEQQQVDVNANNMPGNMQQKNQPTQPQGQFNNGGGQFNNQQSQPSQPSQPNTPPSFNVGSGDAQGQFDQPKQGQTSQDSGTQDNGTPINSEVDSAISNDLDSFMSSIPDFGGDN